MLDDAHDEGEETLTLRLSTPSGGRLADGEATGTIENHDPMPRALLARFGRTAAVHVVEHVEERLQAPRPVREAWPAARWAADPARTAGSMAADSCGWASAAVTC